ncbi:hypothetical protein [Nakamurella endophytica]|uniref:Lipoprotein n=1 Tax=Nakamurella endophytica TaxID=1748367 RepID=A0A917T408_9ACTN|nr:hypothetical protein [Nakamurella endophytica]GGM09484.1 hypothetical protein GCM10011594_31670 [Nakamurella endophytica]
MLASLRSRALVCALAMTTGTALGSCAEPRACSMVAGINGVAVAFDRSITGRVVNLQVCINETCQKGHDATASHGAFVGFPTLDGTAVKVAVSGDTASRTMHFGGSTTATPQAYEPNGPGCGTWWHVDVTVTRSRLVPTS